MSLSRFKDALKGKREIQITVKGRKTGRSISLPVWFTVDGDDLRLLPVKGSASNWYKNLVKSGTLHLSASGVGIQRKTKRINDKATVDKTVQLFREKYGERDVGRYYSRFDAVVELSLSEG